MKPNMVIIQNKEAINTLLKKKKQYKNIRSINQGKINETRNTAWAEK